MAGAFLESRPCHPRFKGFGPREFQIQSRAYPLHAVVGRRRREASLASERSRQLRFQNGKAGALLAAKVRDKRLLRLSMEDPDPFDTLEVFGGVKTYSCLRGLNESGACCFRRAKLGHLNNSGTGLANSLKETWRSTWGSGQITTIPYQKK